MILDDIDNPVCQVSCGRRLPHHDFVSEDWVEEDLIRLQSSNHFVTDGIHVVSLQAFNECLRRLHHLLSGTPTVELILVSDTLEDLHSSSDKLTTIRGFRESGKLNDSLN